MKQWNQRNLLLVSAVAMLAAGAHAADPAKAPAAKAPATTAPAPATTADPAADPAMAAMMQAAAPGANHEILKGMAGTWTFTNVMKMDPAQPAITSTGKATKKMIFGGRYLQEETDSTFMDMPFQGSGTSGYDNVQKKFVGTWIDSAGTGIATMVGTVADGKAINGSVTFWDPMSGKETTARTVTRIESPDKHVFEWWAKGPDGKEFLSMLITYDRAKQTVASVPKK
jgi:hypothetical protein